MTTASLYPSAANLPPNVFGVNVVHLFVYCFFLQSIGMVAHAPPLQALAVGGMITLAWGYTVSTRAAAILRGGASLSVGMLLLLALHLYHTQLKPVPLDWAHLSVALEKLGAENPDELERLWQEARADGVVRKGELRAISQARKAYKRASFP